MAGKLGTDFDPTQPADSGQVRLGASWIRDIKNRLKSFANVVFSLETGALKQNVVPYTSLLDLTPSPVGTWREVTVNSKGLVTAGSNPAELAQVPRVFRGVFTAGSGGVVDTDNGVQNIADPGVSTYLGSGVYHQAYESGSQYYPYAWTVPTGVRRITAWVIGGGGGAVSNGTTQKHSGASGEHRECTMPVTPGTTVSILVGGGGGGHVATPISASGSPGGTSMVSTGSTYVEAAGGGAATGPPGAPGLAQVGATSTNVFSILFPSLAGVSVTPFYVDGLSYYHDGTSPYGTSGDGSGSPAGIETGHKGLVIIEWVK